MENILFPGRPKYTGPITGLFGLLHHERLCEFSHDVNERIAYVRREKAAAEIVIRLHNMIYLGDYKVKFAVLAAAYHPKFARRVSLKAAYYTKSNPVYAEILAYILVHIPDCAWNGEELVFNEKPRQEQIG